MSQQQLARFLKNQRPKRRYRAKGTIQRLVLVSLLEHRDCETGVARVSFKVLSDETETQARALRRYMRAMERAGHIFIETGGMGRGDTNRYRVADSLLDLA